MIPGMSSVRGPSAGREEEEEERVFDAAAAAAALEEAAADATSARPATASSSSSSSARVPPPPTRSDEGPLGTPRCLRGTMVGQSLEEKWKVEEGKNERNRRGSLFLFFSLFSTRVCSPNAESTPKNPLGADGIDPMDPTRGKAEGETGRKRGNAAFFTFGCAFLGRNEE